LSWYIAGGYLTGCKYQEVEIIGSHVGGYLPHLLKSIKINVYWRITQRDNSWLWGRHNEGYDLKKGRF